MTRTHIIIVAAGASTRFGGDTPKQFRSLCGKPVLCRTIDRIREIAPEATLSVVLAADAIDYWKALCLVHDCQSPEIVVGGITRWESVKHALDKLPPDCDLVMIHDGARPFPTREMMKGLTSFPKKFAGVVPGVPMTDSVRRQRKCGRFQACDRSEYFAVQTPQSFRTATLIEAYKAPYQPEFTDDASVVENIGGKIHVVPGDPYNIKITNPLDLQIAEAIYTAKR